MMRINYEKVCKVITTYYPVSIPISDDRYYKYPGMVLINELMKNADEGKWRKFVEKMAGRNAKIMENKFYWGLDGPSYFGRLLLAEKSMGDAFYKRQLFFHVSLLDPLYTVYGIDTISVHIDSELQVNFDPVVFISPMDIYEEWFKVLRKEVEEEYSNASFVPYSILNLKAPSVSIPGALVRYGDKPSVFQALFHGTDITAYRYLGDIRYV